MTHPIIESTARVLRLAVQEYHLLKADKKAELAMREMIHHIIRHATNNEPFGREWSKAVVELAAELGIDRAKHSRQSIRKRFPKDRGITFEHMVPVKTLMWGIIKEPERAEEILMSARIVWVTNEENARLSDMGFAHNRPDPVECYRLAGIEIV